SEAAIEGVVTARWRGRRALAARWADALLRSPGGRPRGSRVLARAGVLSVRVAPRFTLKRSPVPHFVSIVVAACSVPMAGPRGGDARHACVARDAGNCIDASRLRAPFSAAARGP